MSDRDRDVYGPGYGWDDEHVHDPPDRADTYAELGGRLRGDEPRPPRCPYCDRVMSKREAAEQGACNDCYGGAAEP